MATTAERLNMAVYRHRIMWSDLSDRVAANEGIPREDADILVCALIEKESVSLPVAVALIDMIVDGRR